MIIESLVTTQESIDPVESDTKGEKPCGEAAGGIYLSAQGAVFADDWDAPGPPEFFELRPFNSTTTCRNLMIQRCGVLHFTDDANLIARVALGLTRPPLEFTVADSIAGAMLADCCECFEFRVERVDESANRATMFCRCLVRKTVRSFKGFNRASHGLLELAILASRIDFIPVEAVFEQLAFWQPIIDKTGTNKERETCREIIQLVEYKSGRTCPHRG